jgi:integrase
MNNGAQIALLFPCAESFSTISPPKPQTLQDLLDTLKPEGSSGMLQSTTVHISNCLNKPPSDITFEELAVVKSRLKNFLRDRRYKRNTVRTYLNFLRLLVTKAKDLGWSQPCPEVEDAWQKVLPTFSKVPGARVVIRFALQKRITPSQFSDEVLDGWGRESVTQGRTIYHVNHTKSSFRKHVFNSGLDKEFPRLSLRLEKPKYGIPFSELPDQLRTEIGDLIKWKTDAFSVGRPAKLKHRLVTAKALKELLCRICGYARNDKDHEIACLTDLMSRNIIEGFVGWCINERKVKSKTLTPQLGMIGSVLKTYPPFEGHCCDWLPKLVSQLEPDQEAPAKERKDSKWVDYDELAQIPDKIRRDAEKDSSDLKRISLAVRNQLILKWLTTLPWRKQNLITFRFGKRADGANLFKEEISASAPMRKPKWVEDVIRANPNEEIWQFYFRPEETKTGQSVHGVVPKQLVPLLEEYLERFRPALINGDDPQTVFVNEEGRRFSSGTFVYLVRNLTLRYAAKAVNPHLFRDIFAVKWLREHPKDYLTLSKILWHRDLKTTIQTYGQNFDESDGAVAVDEWLEERSLTKKETKH